MPLPIPEKTNKTPIATVLKWYFERKKGKVSEARKEIQRRFEGLDWKDQKKIMVIKLNIKDNICKGGNYLLFSF